VANALSANGAYSATGYVTAVFEYVRNNIAVEYRFGLGKGALGTLIDQSGTPLDQDSLMVALLSYGNTQWQYKIPVSYQAGTVSLSALQFQQWTGFTNAQAGCQFLADGGIPASVNGTNTCAFSVGTAIISVVIGHVWVLANSQVYDPGLKIHVVKSGIDLSQPMGCRVGSQITCGSTVLNYVPAPIPSGITGVNQIQNVDQGHLESTLNGYATHLQQYIQGQNVANRATANPNMQVEDLIGGLVIDMTQLVTTGSPVAAASYANITGPWSDIPDQLRTTLTISFAGITQPVYADETGGRRLRIFNAAVNNTAASATLVSTLYLEYRPLASNQNAAGTGGLPDQTGTLVPLTLLVAHPYAPGAGYPPETLNFNELAIQNWCGSTLGGCSSINWNVNVITVVQGWGDSNESSVTQAAALQQRDETDMPLENPTDYRHIWQVFFPAGGHVPDRCQNEAVPQTIPTGKSGCFETQQPTLAASWLAQASRAARLAGGVNGSAIQLQYSLGTISSGLTTPGITIVNIQSSLSVNSLTAVGSDRTSAFFGLSAVLSRLEGSVLEQQSNLWEGGSAVSMMTKSNANSIAFYDFPNLAAVNNAINSTDGTKNLGTYSPYGQSELQNFASSNFDIIVPQNAAAGAFGILNFGYTGLAAFGLNGDRMTYMTGVFGGDKGAAGGSDPVGMVAQQTTVRNYATKSRTDFAVDLNTGGLTLTPAPDLVTGVGVFPYSLTLQRFYNSKTVSFSCVPDAVLGPLNKTCGRSETETSGLPLGWTHNLAITARLTNDGLASLGRNSALDASAAIAALYTARTLNTGARTFQSNLGTIFTINWLGENLVANVVSVRRPPQVTAFVQLPDGSFNPQPGSADTLSLTAGSRTYNGSGGWDNHTLTFSLTDKQGSTLLFVHGGTGSTVLTAGKTLYLPQSWIFPSGMQVSFTYAPALGSVPGTGPDDSPCLKSIANSLGRALNFHGACGYSQTTPPTIVPQTVVDDALRTVTFQMLPSNLEPSLDTGVTALLVTAADGQATNEYDYVPFPTTHINRTYYNLLDWITPIARSSGAPPYLTVGYDDLFRVASTTDNAIPTPFTTHYYIAGLSGVENQKRGELVDPLSAVTTKYFNRLGSELQSTDPLGRVTTHLYDTFNRPIQTSFPLGNGEIYTYDVRHNQLSNTRFPVPGSGTAATTTTTSYVEAADKTPCGQQASCNKPLTETDGNTGTTTYSWDITGGTGELLSISYPAVPEGTPTTSFTYTTYGLPQTKTEVWQQTPAIKSEITQYNYNTASPMTLVSAVADLGGLNLTTQFVFDNGGPGPGNVTGITDPNGNLTTYQYDSLRRLTEIDYPLSAVTKYTYDLDGQSTSVQRLDSTLSTYQTEVNYYWPTGDLAYTVHPDGLPVAPAAGASTTLASATLPCPSSFMSCFSYDALGRQVVDEEPIQATAVRINSTVYDAAGEVICTFGGRPSAAPAAASDCTSWNPATYAGVGQIRLRSISYSPNGKVQSATDANGNVTTNFYDGLDRLAQLIMPGSIPGSAASCHVPWAAGDNCEVYGYDNNDNLIQKQNRDGAVISITPDAMNRERTRVVPNNAQGQYARTVSKTYDLVGRLSTAGVSGADTESVSYGYDTAGRLLSETDTLLGTVGYLHDANGNRTQITWPGNTNSASFAYDALNRLCKIKENAVTTCVASDLLSTLVGQYTWDSLSRRQALAFGNGVAAGWTYYRDGALNTITHTIGAKSVGITLTRNQARQITAQSMAVNDPTNTLTPSSFLAMPTTATTGYVPNVLNEYSSIGGVITLYDLNGNLTSDGTYSYTYDEENRLRTASGPNTVVYHYDPLGRRKSKTVNSTITQFLSEGAEEIGEYSGTGGLLRYYLNGSSVDEHLVQVEAAGTHYYYSVNHQGSVLATTDGSQNVASISYGPYGESTTAITGVAFRYTGRRLDPETGLYYYRARYYSPTLGRFLQTDPIGNGDDLNLYAYVGNDPLDRTDPKGNYALIDDVAAFVGGGAVGLAFLEARGGDHTWGDYAGAFVSGGVVGLGALYAPTTGGLSLVGAGALIGGTAAATGNLAKQGTDLATGDQKTFDKTSLVVDTAVGSVVGAALPAVPEVKIPGLSAGVGSAEAVAQGVRTKIANGTAKNMSTTTAVKGSMGGQTRDSARTAADAGAEHVKDFVCHRENEQHTC
jgi:RHS repeat-associated protein